MEAQHKELVKVAKEKFVKFFSELFQFYLTTNFLFLNLIFLIVNFIFYIYLFKFSFCIFVFYVINLYFELYILNYIYYFRLFSFFPFIVPYVCYYITCSCVCFSSILISIVSCNLLMLTRWSWNNNNQLLFEFMLKKIFFLIFQNQKFQNHTERPTSSSVTIAKNTHQRIRHGGMLTMQLRLENDH